MEDRTISRRCPKGCSSAPSNKIRRTFRINPEIEYLKYNGLAKIYIQEGKLDRAEELLKKSIENFPYDPEARELLKEIEAPSKKQ